MIEFEWIERVVDNRIFLRSGNYLSPKTSTLDVSKYLLQLHFTAALFSLPPSTAPFFNYLYNPASAKGEYLPTMPNDHRALEAGSHKHLLKSPNVYSCPNLPNFLAVMAMEKGEGAYVSKLGCFYSIAKSTWPWQEMDCHCGKEVIGGKNHMPVQSPVASGEPT